MESICRLILILLLIATPLMAQEATVKEIDPALANRLTFLWQDLQEARAKWEAAKDEVKQAVKDDREFNCGFEISSNFRYMVPKACPSYEDNYGTVIVPLGVPN